MKGPLLIFVSLLWLGIGMWSKGNYRFVPLLCLHRMGINPREAEGLCVAIKGQLLCSVILINFTATSSGKLLLLFRWSTWRSTTGETFIQIVIIFIRIGITRRFTALVKYLFELEEYCFGTHSEKNWF